jgi:hypothetical protein
MDEVEHYKKLVHGFPEKELRDEGCKKIYREPGDLLGRYSELHAFVTRGLQTRGSPYEP